MLSSKRSLGTTNDAEEKHANKKHHVDDSNLEALVAETGIHDQADEELDRLGIPVGWRECPRLGKPIFRFIPMKVPLGPHFDSAIDPDDRFSVQDAIILTQSKIADILIDVPVPPKPGETEPAIERRPAKCNMVIDLTNSSRYYRRETFEEEGGQYGRFYHVKIPNRGRGEVPAPEAVNDFVFEVFSHLNRCPEAFILVHCTHGFNRTGFMIVSYIMRMLSDPTTKLVDVLQSFAEARPPGIYKNYYIQYLFRYYHERPPGGLPPPMLPAWKSSTKGGGGGVGHREHGEDEEQEAELIADLDVDPLLSGAVGRGIQHDDSIGEGVSKTEADWVRSILMEYVLQRPISNPHDAMFPGSQPVSLARSNLDLLHKHRYWVTWKADGTRYLIFIHRTGTYLIDRSNTVTRVQMRWPTPNITPARNEPTPAVPLPAPVGPYHIGTILDGEMVVDEDPSTKLRTRRFLAYDLMVVNGMSCVHQPWGVRWETIKRKVEYPRRFEQEEAAKGKWKTRYDYGGELFRFRRKDFWPLHMADKLVHNFIPKMSKIHEADGLIFQPFSDAYVPLTCQELLKWKFAHMNSVDFKAVLAEGTTDVLKLYLLQPQKSGKAATLRELTDARVVFPNGEPPGSFNGRIIECWWDPKEHAWSFMRERRDKTLPNAFSVYESVVASIRDDIREDELLKEVGKAVKEKVYDDDLGRSTTTPGGGDGGDKTSLRK